MKRFIIHSVLFGIFGFAAYLLFICVWSEVTTRPFRPHAYHRLGWWGHSYSRMNQVRDTANVDVVVLGSSHAYRGFDTRIFGSQHLNTINMGTGAQTPTLTKMLVNRHMDRLSPKVVLFEVTPIVMSGSSVEASLDLVANDRNDVHSFAMAMAVNNIKTWNSLFVSIFKRRLGRNDDFVENASRGKDHYIPGGYVERRLEYFKHFRNSPNHVELNDREVDAIRDIVAGLKEDNIKPILVQAPITPSKYRALHLDVNFDSLMSTIAEYHNFNELIRLDDSLHFYDGHHMNQLGVDTFNAFLLDHLDMYSRIHQ